MNLYILVCLHIATIDIAAVRGLDVKYMHGMHVLSDLCVHTFMHSWYALLMSMHVYQFYRLKWPGCIIQLYATRKCTLKAIPKFLYS